MRSHLGKENESVTNNKVVLVYTETFKLVQTKVINIISICILVVTLFYTLRLQVNMTNFTPEIQFLYEEWPFLY